MHLGRQLDSVGAESVTASPYFPGRLDYLLMKLKPVRRSIGLLLLFDGVAAFLAPGEYPRRFEFGPPLIDDILEYIAENPDLTRKFSLAEIALGLWLTIR